MKTASDLGLAGRVISGAEGQGLLASGADLIGSGPPTAAPPFCPSYRKTYVREVVQTISGTEIGPETVSVSGTSAFLAMERPRREAIPVTTSLCCDVQRIDCGFSGVDRAFHVDGCAIGADHFDICNAKKTKHMAQMRGGVVDL